MKIQPTWASEERLASLARRFGTPLYVYDLASIQRRLDAFSGFDRVRFAVKANPNLAVLSALRLAGAVCDSVSKGEVDRALAAGFAPDEIVFTADLMDRDAREAVAEHRLHVNAGSITMIDQVADIGGFDSITLRINPGFGDGHDQKVTTGGPNSKHGIWHGSLKAACDRAASRGLAVTGLHVHIGSGVGTDRLHDTIAAMGRAVDVCRETVKSVSCGGGMSIPYRETDDEFHVATLAAAWDVARSRWSSDLGRRLELEVEPGRYLVAQSGVLLAEVCGINDTRTPGGDGSDGHTFILVDAGFHTLARPVLYGSYHRITALGRSGQPTRPQLVAGPLCESADVFTQAKDGSPAPQELPEMTPGDLLAIHDTGAYGASMSSCYNSRPLPAEVVLTGDGAAHLAKPALDLDRLIAEECAALPPSLS